MKRFSFRIKKKNFIWFLSFVLALLVAFGLNQIRLHITGSIASQNMVDRWGSSKFGQVSLFTAPDAELSEESILFFEHALDAKLQEESIVVESENESARLWVDTYSTDAQLTFNRDKKNATGTVYGVGGDFFLLHPMEFISGEPFSSTDINHDFVVLDEDMAWQLFGATDVAGLSVSFNGELFYVKGVVRREEGKFAKAAGLDKPIAFLFFDAMNAQLGGELKAKHYEILMPNPVSGYAIAKVKDLMGINEEENVLVDNTERYAFWKTITELGDFGIREMRKSPVVFPFWENIARGYEAVNRLFVFFTLPFVVYCILFVVGFLIHWYRHKTWTIVSVVKSLREKQYDLAAKRQEKKNEVTF